MKKAKVAPPTPSQAIGWVIAIACLACMPADAQQANLSLASGSTKPGGSVGLALSLSNAGSTQPGSVEWSMSYSAADISGVSVTTSPGAAAENKTVSCNVGQGQTVCVLSGLDENTIAAGPLATVTFQVAVSSQSTNIPVQLTGLAATADGSALPLAAAGGTITSTGSGASPVPSTSVSIWPSTAVPGTSSVNDGTAVEVGMKFRSDVAGTVSGVRFYKGLQNTGMHLGHLWSSNGTLLGTVTFKNETASGWQQAVFASPIMIPANTTYIVSYYAPVGHYSADNNFFTAAVNTLPLHALQSGTDGLNGVYIYGASAFPNQSYKSTNYWVDLLFTPGAGSTTPTAPAAAASVWTSPAIPGTVTTEDGSAVELGMKFRSDSAGQITGVRFYKGPQNSGVHVGHLWSSGGVLLGSVTFHNETTSGWQQANFASPLAIQANTTYIVSYYAPAGYYSSDNGFFSSAVNTPPLHALQDGADGPNGVYVYGSDTFPNQSWYSSNYWVDVVFTPSTK